MGLLFKLTIMFDWQYIFIINFQLTRCTLQYALRFMCCRFLTSVCDTCSELLSTLPTIVVIVFNGFRFCGRQYPMMIITAERCTEPVGLPRALLTIDLSTLIQLCGQIRKLLSPISKYFQSDFIEKALLIRTINTQSKMKRWLSSMRSIWKKQANFEWITPGQLQSSKCSFCLNTLKKFKNWKRIKMWLVLHIQNQNILRNICHFDMFSNQFPWEAQWANSNMVNAHQIPTTRTETHTHTIQVGKTHRSSVPMTLYSFKKNTHRLHGNCV